MTSNSFVHALAALAPARADLPVETADKLAANSEDYTLLASEFIAVQRKRPRKLILTTGSDLDNLLSNYEIDQVAIMGDIQFYSDVFITDGIIAIATGTCGTFSITREGAIILNENSFEAPEFVCAKNIEDFYCILLIFSQYYQQRLLGKVERNDLLSRQKYAQQVAEAAGNITDWQDYLLILNTSLPLLY